ncbi:uncharacterized protein LOC133300333 [Gastrolobium bilobum]|uniref:uncharacterized protein LOC133300333 n=1 Tax=Gastrolobium bilobum TaxID=150636 RepID=UPI002AB071C1|nr:uncharacterized protein LOC133300333 [Gastrolobium bilobum]
MDNRSLRQLTAPDVKYQSFCIRYLDTGFKLKSGLIHLLPKFHGLAGEDPYKYLKEFHVVCNTMKPQGVDEEQVKLRAFPFSLDGGAKDWLYYLQPSSIETWNDMARLFLEKFFPSSRATSIRKEISGIKQANEENLHEYWERFKRLCASCPHHQIPEQLLIVYLYEGLLHMDRNLIDAASGGVLVNKTPNEAKALISNMAANAQQFGTRANSSVVYQVQETPTQPSAVASSADNQQIENRLDELATMVRQLAVTQTVQTSVPQFGNPCGICSDHFHSTDACPSLQEGSIPADQLVAAVFPGKPQFQQQQSNPFSNTYNPGWKNHPNLKWNQNQQNVPYQQSQQNFPYQQKQQFIPQQRQNFQQPAPQQLQQQPPVQQQNSVSGPFLEDLMKQMATNNLEFQQRTESTIQNLQTQIGQLATSMNQQMEEPNQADVESSKGGDTSSKKQSTDTSDVHIPLPFPQRATQSKKQSAKARDKEILDTFRKVEVNIPLLDAIQQIPRYAKFLKELCTNKRRLKGDEQVNLNLGASINVMPESVYKSLGLGPLCATSIVVTLANRSSIHPSGLIEDVLVRVNNLIFPADFYILEMESETATNRSPIILGRPFMRTTRTKIDVHSGTLSMEFGDSILHFSIFDSMKHSKVQVDHSVSCIKVIHDVADKVDFELISDCALPVDYDLPINVNSECVLNVKLCKTPHSGNDFDPNSHGPKMKWVPKSSSSIFSMQKSLRKVGRKDQEKKKYTQKRKPLKLRDKQMGKTCTMICHHLKVVNEGPQKQHVETEALLIDATYPP